MAEALTWPTTSHASSPGRRSTESLRCFSDVAIDRLSEPDGHQLMAKRLVDSASTDGPPWVAIAFLPKYFFCPNLIRHWYNWVADSMVDMQLLTCRVDSASARGGACRWWSLVFHACGRVPAVHTCGEGKAGLGGHWGADLCWELSGQLSCGGSNRMWRMLHRIMLKFKSAL